MFVAWSLSPYQIFAQLAIPVAESSGSGKSAPLHISADQIKVNQINEVYEAQGSVVVEQGPFRLTAEEATLHQLSGKLTAVGRVHLRDKISEVWSEQLELNVNTEAGVITNGTLHGRETNTWLQGRLLQRFSETHYRGKDGVFTNCDADDGQIPDWSFSFKDVDLQQQESVYAEGVWFRIRDQLLIPFPALRYPMPGVRKTGFLVPTVAFNNEFGFIYRQGFFWALSPSQDLTITPQILTERGYGGDVEYRYILSRKAKGNWLVRTLNDTEVDRVRALITGSHVHQFNPDLSVRAKVNYVTDRTVFQDLSNSGAFRALPSQESVLNINQRLRTGSAYLMAQYLQPLESGGQTTFQRLPELGHRFRSSPFFGETLVVGMDSTFVHFAREEGFDVTRIDLFPGISTQGLHAWNVVGLTPQFKLLEVIYSHGRDSSQDNWRDRGTYWAGFEASSNLSKRFRLEGQRSLRHTIEPKLFYEYVPSTEQDDLVQIDATDDLIKKNLLTYSLSSRLQEHSKGGSMTLFDLFLAQSYHLSSAPGDASIFSNIWGRATGTLPVKMRGPLTQISLTVDSYIDPGDAEFSQFNSDLRLQAGENWYLTVGQRYTRSGLVPRRGDIWNPISFNEVLAPQAEINFFTFSGAIRMTNDLTIGTKVYRDFDAGVTSEWDLVGLYQNPCRCWSFGVYYQQLGGTDEVEQRNQFNFVLTFRGIGATPGLGTQLLQDLLGPLLGDEHGVPWSPR